MAPRRIAGWMGALAVAAGAFGAHGLKDHVTPDRLVTWETGARYHLIHAVVLLLLALLPEQTAAIPRAVFWLFLAGIFIFSGSLYALVLLDLPILGMVTPVGGLCLIAGWAGLARSAGS
jgi:uncharacterized membrane protein YgdD (TMEM256/DUF423 family)